MIGGDDVSHRTDDNQTLLADWTGLEPGRSVILRPQSPLHKGDYECSVLEKSVDRLRVSMPMEDGKIVLVPVGTIVSIEAQTDAGAINIRAQVVDRRGGRQRSLVLGPEPRPPSYLTPGPPTATCRTIAITSGKGGVGKTAFTINLGTALAEMDQRVCIIDGDLGTANVDVLLNMTPRYNLAHVVNGEKNIFDVLVQGPHGLVVLPGGSGLQELTSLDDRQFGKLLAQFHRLERYADVILLDTGSGLSRAVTNFVQAADEAIIITTPEPHAITDAYALIKVASRDHAELKLRLVVNRVQDEAEAREIARKMMFASLRFLETDMRFLGHIVDDPTVSRAIRQQQDLLSSYPKSRAAICVRTIAQTLVGEMSPVTGEADDDAEAVAMPPDPTPKRSFLHRIRQLFAR